MGIMKTVLTMEALMLWKARVSNGIGLVRIAEKTKLSLCTHLLVIHYPLLHICCSLKRLHSLWLPPCLELPLRTPLSCLSAFKSCLKTNLFCGAFGTLDLCQTELIFLPFILASVSSSASVFPQLLYGQSYSVEHNAHCGAIENDNNYSNSNS